MKVERFTVQACCGNVSIMFKTDQPLTTELLSKLVAQGFNEHLHFTQAGILYVDNLDFIMTGPIGSDRLQVKCKRRDCEQNLNDLEALLLQLG